MKILITGVAGFIGFHVAKYLTEQYPQHQIVGLDKLTYCSSTKDLDFGSNFQFIQADVLEIYALRGIFQSFQIDTVMHFAAYSHVDHSFGNSVIFTENNVFGTHRLLEIAREFSVTRFIHVSTDEVYGDTSDVSHEQHILEPTNPYAATKAAAEHLARSYYHSYKLPVMITRSNNVYGPRQYPEKVIPRFCYRLLQGDKCQIQGTGTQTRSFIYIDDIVRAFETILFHGIPGETYNIGTNREVSIKELIAKLVEKIYPDDPVDHHVEFAPDRNFNDTRYLISSNKLEKLGWKIQVDFEEGLEKTLEWYRNNPTYWADITHCLDCTTQKLI